VTDGLIDREEPRPTPQPPEPPTSAADPGRVADAPGPSSPPSQRGRTLAAAGLVVSAAFLASRVLGWVRTVVLIAVFDASQELDSFFAAFRLPDLVFQLVAAGALGSALIPVASGLLGAQQHDRAWRVVSSVANLMLVGLAVLAVVLAIAAPVIVPAITPGFDAIQVAQTVELTRIMLLGPVFLAMGAVATSTLNASGRFAAAALAPIIYNVAIIAAAIGLSPFLGVRALAVGVVAGSLGHLLVQLPALRRIGFRYEPIARLRDPHTRRTLALMAPRALGLGASQITFVVVTSLASTLGVGAITAYNAAFTLLQIPIGVIGVPLGVVVFPSLSRQAAGGLEIQYVALVTRGLRLLLYVMLPIAGLLAILRRQVVGVLFPGLDPDAADLTADALLFFCLGLAAHALIALLARAFYARQDTRTPVGAALLAVVVNSVLAVVLVGPMGLGGIALAIAVAAWLETVVLLVLLTRRVPALGVGDLVRVGLEAGLASVAAGAVGLLVLYTIDDFIGTDPGLVALIVQSVIVGVVFGAMYLVLSVALRIPELGSIITVMTDVLRRRRRS
jgi:putative peptidoglycan lipid II flippase